MVNAGRKLTGDSSVPSLAHAAHGSNIFVSVFWIVVTVGFTAYSISETMKITKKFLAYEKRVVTKLNYDTEVDFPAVTACNLNPYKKSALTSLPHLKTLISGKHNNTDAGQSNETDTLVQESTIAKTISAIATTIEEMETERTTLTMEHDIWENMPENEQTVEGIGGSSMTSDKSRISTSKTELKSKKFSVSTARQPAEQSINENKENEKKKVKVTKRIINQAKTQPKTDQISTVTKQKKQSEKVSVVPTQESIQSNTSNEDEGHIKTKLATLSKEYSHSKVKDHVTSKGSEAVSWRTEVPKISIIEGTIQRNETKQDESNRSSRKTTEVPNTTKQSIDSSKNQHRTPYDKEGTKEINGTTNKKKKTTTKVHQSQSTYNPEEMLSSNENDTSRKDEMNSRFTKDSGTTRMTNGHFSIEDDLRKISTMSSSVTEEEIKSSEESTTNKEGTKYNKCKKKKTSGEGSQYSNEQDNGNGNKTRESTKEGKQTKSGETHTNKNEPSVQLQLGVGILGGKHKENKLSTKMNIDVQQQSDEDVDNVNSNENDDNEEDEEEDRTCEEDNDNQTNIQMTSKQIEKHDYEAFTKETKSKSGMQTPNGKETKSDDRIEKPKANKEGNQTKSNEESKERQGSNNKQTTKSNRGSKNTKEGDGALHVHVGISLANVDVKLHSYNTNPEVAAEIGETTNRRNKRSSGYLSPSYIMFGGYYDYSSGLVQWDNGMNIDSSLTVDHSLMLWSGRLVYDTSYCDTTVPGTTITAKKESVIDTIEMCQMPAAENCSQSCPANFVLYNCTCYYLKNNYAHGSMSASIAKTNCASVGAQLVYGFNYDTFTKFIVTMICANHLAIYSGGSGSYPSVMSSWGSWSCCDDKQFVTRYKAVYNQSTVGTNLIKTDSNSCSQISSLPAICNYKSTTSTTSTSTQRTTTTRPQTTSTTKVTTTTTATTTLTPTTTTTTAMPSTTTTSTMPSTTTTSTMPSTTTTSTMPSTTTTKAKETTTATLTSTTTTPPATTTATESSSSTTIQTTTESTTMTTTTTTPFTTITTIKTTPITTTSTTIATTTSETEKPIPKTTTTSKIKTPLTTSAAETTTSTETKTKTPKVTTTTTTSNQESTAIPTVITPTSLSDLTVEPTQSSTSSTSLTETIPINKNKATLALDIKASTESANEQTTVTTTRLGEILSSKYNLATKVDHGNPFMQKAIVTLNETSTSTTHRFSPSGQEMATDENLMLKGEELSTAEKMMDTTTAPDDYYIYEDDNSTGGFLEHYLSMDNIMNILNIENNSDPLAIETKIKEALPYIVGSLTDKQRQSVGFQRSDMIESCIYAGEDCLEDILQWNDASSGNCFTFNSKNLSDPLRTRRSGSFFGVSIRFLLNQQEYLSTSDSAGIKLFIHDPETPIFTSTEGFIIPSGYKISFSLHMVNSTDSFLVHKRFLGSFTFIDRNEEIILAVWQLLDNRIGGNKVEYFEGCLRSCYQSRILHNCGCGDPNYPLPPFSQKRKCDIDKLACVKNFTSEIYDTNGCDCQEPCMSKTFDSTTTNTMLTTKVIVYLSFQKLQI